MAEGSPTHDMSDPPVGREIRHEYLTVDAHLQASGHPHEVLPTTAPRRRCPLRYGPLRPPPSRTLCSAQSSPTPPTHTGMPAPRSAAFDASPRNCAGHTKCLSDHAVLTGPPAFRLRKFFTPRRERLNPSHNLRPPKVHLPAMPNATLPPRNILAAHRAGHKPGRPPQAKDLRVNPTPEEVQEQQPLAQKKRQSLPNRASPPQPSP